MSALLAQCFLKQTLNADLLKFASFDVPSSPQVSGLRRLTGKRTIHKDLLRKQTISDPRLKYKSSGYTAETGSDRRTSMGHQCTFWSGGSQNSGTAANKRQLVPSRKIDRDYPRELRDAQGQFLVQGDLGK